VSGAPPVVQTRDIYRGAGFTGFFELGSRPALLVVDLCRGFTDPRCALGADATEEVERTRAVLDVARSRGVLVVFTTIACGPGALVNTAWLRKVPSLGQLIVGSPWVDIDSRLGRLAIETLVAKHGASAFFGMPVASMLLPAMWTACWCSGHHVRVCAGFGRRLRAVRLRHLCRPDCCADRSSAPHEANLFDMTAKVRRPAPPRRWCVTSSACPRPRPAEPAWEAVHLDVRHESKADSFTFNASTGVAAAT